jgi:hypothetical protein
MNKPFITLALLSFHLVAVAAFGTLTGTSVNGENRYCKYSNGVVITIKSYEVCPTTNG